MPRPVERGQRYVPALDGVRAVAVLAVLAYHLNLGWAGGGMLGVGVFFTLSGYLITDLLLEHGGGGLGLREFWVRRARRLLPALFVMLAVVSVLVAVFDASQLAEVRRQVISAALYFANWSTIAAHQSYFSRFAAPLPLDHLWSLSIEEQFYLVWPWIVLLAVVVLRSRGVLFAVCLAGAAGSLFVMATLYHPGYDPTRVYEGTDTRAFALLLGAALAVVRPLEADWGRRSRRGRRSGTLGRSGGLGRAARRRRLSLGAGVAFDLLGWAALIGILLLIWRTTAFTPFLYPWGFLLLSLATVVILAVVVVPASLLGAFLSLSPLRWIGVRSYGIYLWQWPIVVLWDQGDQRFLWARALLQTVVTLVVAAASWRWIEQPIRSGALHRLALQARARRRAPRARRIRLSLGAAAAILLAAVVVSLDGLLPVASAGTTHPQEIARLPGAVASGPAPKRRARQTKPAKPLPPPTHTSCRKVVYIGDSTSEGETSPDYIPNPRQRLFAQLHGAGVNRLYPEISGGRSIVETIKNIPDAATVARGFAAHGYSGCWILALGTNDAADVAIGSYVGMRQRITRMMRIIGNQPVLWVDAITLLADGPYAEKNMEQWNRDLLAACDRYPTMRVFDWAAHAKRRWFIPDGIHYYSPGYVARSHQIAHGLVEAFPRGRSPSSSCLVS